MLDDGVAGLWAVKRSGIVIVQDPAEAAYADMPLAALQEVAVNHCLPLEGIATLLNRLVREPVATPLKPCSRT